ncbi:hypothetical protein POM88_010923 [Heracleum sosnowskyi]|uniref:Uncharacterized protein n=1 Tax=Heracleum sosnowskyi TaxID=360622 RepID=A0AAD8ITL4_9APIA|nr:hypothetical protein POM88_010923 [Heracleum sosnowskyi]
MSASAVFPLFFPNTELLEAASDAISKFLKSDSHNLKYMGADTLGRLIKISPDISEQHQLAVIDCLELVTVELLLKFKKASDEYWEPEEDQFISLRYEVASKLYEQNLGQMDCKQKKH